MFETNDTKVPLPEDIEYEFTLKPDADEELGQYILHFHGWARIWDDTALEEVKIAEIEGLRLDLASAHADGYNDDALLEQISSDISDFSEVVLHHQNCMVAKGIDTDEKIECGCLVFINEIKVDENYRGHGLGSNLLRRLPSMIDVSDCLLALKAFPLADEYGQPTDPEKIKRIKHFYEQLGFQHVGGEFMTKDARLCEAMRKRLMGRKV